MDNDRIFEILEQIRSEISKMAIALERHTMQLDINSRDTKDAKAIAEKALDCHTNCPARRKHESHATVAKDLMGVSALIASTIALLKVFGVIK
jgi:hypothetical protein